MAGKLFAVFRSSATAEFARFLRTEKVGGLFLLAATVIALALANSPAAGFYQAMRQFALGPDVLHLRLSLDSWAKDGLLALFFYVAGVELKRELVVGELSDRKAATLPVAAAVGGMVVPAAIALAVGAGDPAIARAWAIPIATDIAFALGVPALAVPGLPSGVRIFLLSLAVVDDLGAIVVIAVVFTGSVSVLAVAIAVVLLGGYAYLQCRRIRTAWVYVPLALGTWVAVHAAGLHATIAGVALGLLTRARADPVRDAGERHPPTVRMEHLLQPWSAAVAVPLFALFAAGISVNGSAFASLASNRVALAVMAGLVVGKPLGVFGFAFLAVKLRIAARPDRLGWGDLVAVAVLCGVGFTVSLLLTELALAEPAVGHAKLAVLLASAFTALAAAVLLRARYRTRAGDGGVGR